MKIADIAGVLEELDFSGGKAAAVALPAEKGESEGTGTPAEVFRINDIKQRGFL